jgi:hypothetical protein
VLGMMVRPVLEKADMTPASFLDPLVNLRPKTRKLPATYVRGMWWQVAQLIGMHAQQRLRRWLLSRHPLVPGTSVMCTAVSVCAAVVKTSHSARTCDEARKVSGMHS